MLIKKSAILIRIKKKRMKNYNLNKVVGIIGVVGIGVMSMACTETPAVEEEIIIVHDTPVVVEVENDPPDKSTTISLDKDGLNVETDKIKVDIEK